MERIKDNFEIVVPIRSTETDIVFTDYEVFKTDLTAYKETQKLIRLINLEPFIIEDINFEFLELKDIIENKIYYQCLTHIGQREFKNDYLRITIKVNRNIQVFDYNIEVSRLVIRKLGLLINLSYEMSFDFMKGILIDPKENLFIGSTDIWHSHFDFAYTHTNKMNWPYLKGISISTTINWLLENDIPLNGISNSEASRAVNALSHLFSDLTEKDSSFLFWSMLGIEALLAEGNENISSQIHQKSILVLGEPKEYKRKLKQLYNYRSRLVHGETNFPAKYTDDGDLFDTEYWDYLAFSVSILLSLIRKLIVGNKTKFDFQLVYVSDHRF